ncbi:MAG: sugar phosphate isomerase/epimerase [Myxococcales bacterium]|nr:sugar phosphate isomerase/epimerase [Myxococcales bacterium]
MISALSTHLFVYNRLRRQHLAWIAAAGFRRLELWCAEHHFDFTDPAAVADLRAGLREHGLRVQTMHLPFYHGFGTPEFRYIGFTHPEIENRALMGEKMRAILALCEPLDCRCLVLHPVSTPRPDGSHIRRLRAALDWFVPQCRRQGVTIALENIMQPESRTEILAGVCDDYSGQVGICLDTGHAHIDGGLIWQIHNAGRHLIALHVHGNHGATDEHLLPGNGTIDWPAALSALRMLAPNAHYFTYELLGPKTETEETDAHFRALLAAAAGFDGRLPGGRT